MIFILANILSLTDKGLSYDAFNCALSNHLEDIALVITVQLLVASMEKGSLDFGL